MQKPYQWLAWTSTSIVLFAACLSSFIPELYIHHYFFLIGNTCAALLNFDSAHILYAIFLLFVGVSIISIWMLPQLMMRYAVATVMNFFYKLDVIGMSNIPEEGGVMIIGNHTSYIDWAILQMASPRQIRFVMERSIYEKWYLKWLLSALNRLSSLPR